MYASNTENCGFIPGGTTKFLEYSANNQEIRGIQLFA